MNKLTLSIISTIIFLFYTSCSWAAPKHCEDAKKVVNDIGHAFAKKYQMHLLTVGTGSLIDAPKTKWVISLVSEQQMTIEQARPLIKEMINTFWDKVQKDQVFSNYLKLESSKYYYIDPTLSQKDIGIKIAFWDVNVNRPLHPYLSQIRVVGGDKVYFHYADPKDQSLQEPIVEEVKDLKEQ